MFAFQWFRLDWMNTSRQLRVRIGPAPGGTRPAYGRNYKAHAPAIKYAQRLCRRVWTAASRDPRPALTACGSAVREKLTSRFKAPERWGFAAFANMLDSEGPS